MATTKRGLRHTRREFGLTEAQRECLLYGVPLLSGGPGFTTDTAAAAAWRQYRDELMQDCREAGRRPRAFFKFELDQEPRTWIEEADILDRAGLLDLDEQRRVEGALPALDPRQNPQFCSNVPQFFQDSPYILQTQAAEFRIAAEWHARRGRAGLEAKYRGLVAEIESKGTT